MGCGGKIFLEWMTIFLVRWQYFWEVAWQNIGGGVAKIYLAIPSDPQNPKVIPRKQGKTSANRKREFKKNFLLEIIGNPPLLSNIKFGHKEDFY